MNVISIARHAFISPHLGGLRGLIFLIILHFSFFIHAQQQWSLTQCIDYALQHNISLQQKEYSRQQSELKVSTARNARLPNLEGYAQENFSFGRGLTIDNTYTNKSTNSTSLGLSTSVPLFTGGRIPNQLKLAKLNLEAATADLEKARNDISTQVAQKYISAVYDLELIGVAQRQVTIDSMQLARLQEMLRDGKASGAEVSQQEATLQGSRLTTTKAINDYQLALLDLSQLLELPTPDGFSVAAPTKDLQLSTFNLQLPQPQDIYAQALGIKPEIAAEQLRLQASERSIDIAKAARYPSLSFSGSLGTNYYKTSGITGDSFGKQIKNNFSQGIGLSLSIPIFNRFETRNSILSAQIDRRNQALVVENAKKTLYKEIQQVYYNAVAAQSQYISSEAAEHSSEDAFALMQGKYEAGKATITEFNESKNNLLKAQSDLLRARYEYIYQRALIDFYEGNKLTM